MPTCRIGRPSTRLAIMHEAHAGEPLPRLLSRRTLLSGVIGAATILAAGNVALDTSPASATILWNHPFTVRGGRPIGGHFGSTVLDTGQPRLHPHQGQDYSPPLRGVPFYSVAAGTVVANGLDGGYGWRVIIDHGGGVRTLYAHMDPQSTMSVNVAYPAGSQVGLIGSTGNSTGAHLHIEVRVNGVQVDPVPYIHDAPLAGSPGVPITPNMENELIPRVISQSSGYVILTDEWSKPLPGVTSDQVIELNKFLTYDPSYYPNGKLGAAVMSSAQYAFFQGVLTPPS